MDELFWLYNETYAQFRENLTGDCVTQIIRAFGGDESSMAFHILELCDELAELKSKIN